MKIEKGADRVAKKLVIIHTTPVTVNSLKEIAVEYLKGYMICNLLDDSILPEVISEGEITEGVKFRFNNLLMCAETMKPDAILCACSSIGELVDSGKTLIKTPVLRIDEPMVNEAVEKGIRIGVAATLPSTLRPTKALIIKKAEEEQKTIELESLLIEGVNSLLSEGKGDLYDERVASKLLDLAEKNDVVVLAQASMARALAKVPGDKKHKFLTSPKSGIASVKQLLGE